MATKRRFVGSKSRTIKFRKQDKTKVRKSVKFSKTKSKRSNKKRKHNTKRRFRLKGGVNDECPICREKFKADDETITTSCGHKFHKNELIEWCRRKPFGMRTCPMDRINISEDLEGYLEPNLPPNVAESDSDSENYSEDMDIELLQIFVFQTMNLLNNMPYFPLPDAPYLDGVDLPLSVEGGAREKIKNMLICLFAEEDYFWQFFSFLNIGSNLVEIIDDEDEEGVDRLKVALISHLMNLVNNNRNYSDAQLRQLIGNYLEICAANRLQLVINPLPNLNI